MSNYEHHVGKIKLVDENFTKEKLEKILSEDDIDEENTLEGRETYSIYNNNYDVKYVVHKDKLFQILEHKEFGDDLHVQSLSDNGEFTMLFYNGGTCFSEMLEESIEENMQKVNTLRVEVKYVVELSDFEIPQELFEEMEDLQGHTIYPSRAQIEYPEVLDWLSENIKEGDACDWEYEIDEISATE